MKRFRILVVLACIELFFASCATVKEVGIFTDIAKAVITPEGEKPVMGTAQVSVKGKKAIVVLVEHSDYLTRRFTIKPSKEPLGIGNQAVGALSALGIVAGGIGILTGELSATDDSISRNDREAFKAMEPWCAFGIVSGLFCLFVPFTKWEKQYELKMGPFYKYDAQGYDKVTGFNKAGYDRGGKSLTGGRFDGKIVNGKKTGWGSYTDPAGEVFTGTFANDVLDGIGKQATKDGSIFVGTWKAGKKTGIGIVRRKTGDFRQVWDWGALKSEAAVVPFMFQGKSWFYLGEVANDGKANGIGDAYSSDLHERIENGQFMEGRLALGGYRTSAGSFMEGVFEDDYLVSGRCVMPDGRIYSGDFIAGSLEGLGSLSYPNGDLYDGEFRAGLPDGKGTYYSTGKVEAVEFSKGNRTDRAYLDRLALEKAEAEREKAELARLELDLARREAELENEQRAARSADADRRAEEDRLARVELYDKVLDQWGRAVGESYGYSSSEIDRINEARREDGTSGENDRVQAAFDSIAAERLELAKRKQALENGKAGAPVLSSSPRPDAPKNASGSSPKATIPTNPSASTAPKTAPSMTPSSGLSGASNGVWSHEIEISHRVNAPDAWGKVNVSAENREILSGSQHLMEVEIKYMDTNFTADYSKSWSKPWMEIRVRSLDGKKRRIDLDRGKSRFKNCSPYGVSLWLPSADGDWSVQVIRFNTAEEAKTYEATLFLTIKDSK